MLGEADRLFRFLGAHGCETWGDVTTSLVEGFCWGARPDRHGVHRRPSESTAKNRQWVARAVLETAESLGADVDADKLLGNRIPRRAIKPTTRPLTDYEARQVEVFAYERLIAPTRPLQVAFSFAGATATEIAVMRVRAVNLEAATVEFAGEAARTNRLDGWALETVERFFHHNPGLDDDALLCVSRRTDEHQAAHSVTVLLREVLIEAGIAGLDGVTARSIRLTGARRVLDASGIEAAARFLGANSLDAAAVALGTIGGTAMAGRGPCLFSDLRPVRYTDVHGKSKGPVELGRDDDSDWEEDVEDNPDLVFLDDYRKRKCKEAPLDLGDIELLEFVVSHEPLLRIAWELESLVKATTKNNSGRPREYNVLGVFLLEMGAAVWVSYKKAERNLADPHVWARLSNALANAHPDNETWRLSPKPMTRGKHYRFCKRYMNDHLLDVVENSFIADAVEAATAGELHRSIADSYNRPSWPICRDHRWSSPSDENPLQARRQPSLENPRPTRIQSQQAGNSLRSRLRNQQSPLRPHR